MLWGKPADLWSSCQKAVKQQVKLWAFVLTLDSSLPGGEQAPESARFSLTSPPTYKRAVSTCWIGGLKGNPYCHANHILKFPLFLGCAVFLPFLEFFLRFFALDLSLGLVSSSSIRVNASVPSGTEFRKAACAFPGGCSRGPSILPTGVASRAPKSVKSEKKIKG